MRLSKTVLLAGSMLAALLAPHAALAETPPAPESAPAAPEAPASGDAGTESPDIVVLGFGKSRQVQTVDALDIARIVPGASPLKAIEKLPGVNFQSADAFGNYEWAVRISLRGFNQNQLGFTLDGIPLGDMSYGTTNGLHISRAIISENVGSTDVAQGAGALGTASTSNLGGTIQFHSDDPKDTMNVTGSGTYGSNNTWRGVARLDSGLIGDTVKGYISYAYYKTDKWKGYGQQKQQQVNAKVTADLGTLGDISAYFAYSDRKENDYQDLSLDMIKRRGLSLDNISNNYPLAIAIATAAQAGQPLPGGGTLDDSYYDAAGLRRDYLGGVTFNAKLAPGVTVKTTGYYHENTGQGSWITPYNPTPLGALNTDGTPITNPAPLSFRTTEYGLKRGGIISALSYEAGANTFGFGGWYESSTLNIARRLYGMTLGTPNRSALDYQSNPYATAWDGKYDTDTLQYHVEDTLKLAGDTLEISAGWKGVQVINNAKLRVGTLAQGRIDARDWFQPQASVLYRATQNVELFADYTENMRAFTSSAAGGPFATTQVLFDAVKNTLKPEKSKTVEGGVRLRSGGFQASAVGYYVDFSNRLLSVANGVGILGNSPTLNNVGSVHTYGGEFSVNYRIVQPLSIFASYSYNHSQYQDNVSTAITRDTPDGLIHTKGKTAVDSPEHMLKGEIVYDQYGITARVGADYMSKRYFTYSNDRSVPGRVTMDASIGYRFDGDGPLHGFAIVGNVTNLTDKKYIATIGSNGFTNSGDNQTLLAGAPRQFFVTVKKGF
ncbi:TonB-dependent receptor [Sphingomonas panacis]|uniref:TonB-dependent receptor n=1 Tax=Sphingomonas panacis TaxID=1560345 RepID=UPI000A70933B|nr:TonB-dependent receptor [Sphingomonas panacis]